MGKIPPIGQARNAWAEWEYVEQDMRNPRGQLVYMVRAVDGNGRPVRISLPNGSVDHGGTLYIGETCTLTNLHRETRYRLLTRSFQSQRKKPHSAVKKYFQRQLNQTYPISQIQTCYKIMAKQSPEGQADGKPMAVTSERSEIQSYENRYGKLPLLNSIRGKHL